MTTQRGHIGSSDDWLESFHNHPHSTEKLRRMARQRNSTTGPDSLGLSVFASFLNRRSTTRPFEDSHFPELFEEDSLTDDEIDRWFVTLTRDASDAGEPLPSTNVIDEAKRIVRNLRHRLPQNTDVYSMDRGKVAVELYGNHGHGFLLVCEPGGGALCTVTAKGVSRRARYEISSTLPDGFLVEGLEEILQWPRTRIHPTYMHEKIPKPARHRESHLPNLAGEDG